MDGRMCGPAAGLVRGLDTRFARRVQESTITGADMTMQPAEDRVRVGPSGEKQRPIRIEAPGREPLDLTRAELLIVQRATRDYLLRTFPAPSVRRSDSGG